MIPTAEGFTNISKEYGPAIVIVPAALTLAAIAYTLYKEDICRFAKHAYDILRE